MGRSKLQNLYFIFYAGVGHVSPFLNVAISLKYCGNDVETHLIQLFIQNSSEYQGNGHLARFKISLPKWKDLETDSEEPFMVPKD